MFHLHILCLCSKKVEGNSLISVEDSNLVHVLDGGNLMRVQQQMSLPTIDELFEIIDDGLSAPREVKC